MQKYSFKNDYSEGCHPSILEKLLTSNTEQLAGYGLDKFSDEAKNAIKNYIKSPSSEIHFVVGGTQANLICISSVLKPYQAVIAAETGHIVVHETGAIEATGHKILTVKTTDGKLNPEQINSVLALHTDEHMVQPKMVYISNSTEIGSIYTKSELEDLYLFCQENSLYLFLDGARLGAALTSKSNDLTLEDIAKNTDLFYIGGTKNGALLGEAIVINCKELQENFRFHIKQKGAMLAKGRLLGIQFLSLFENDLFFELGKKANDLANKLAESFIEKGYQFLIKPESNQIFPILTEAKITELENSFEFYRWEKLENNQSAVRLVTSWATDEQQIDRFISML